MDTIMGFCYFGTVVGMGWNLVKIKLQVDFEEDIKGYREYDFSTEKIKVGTDKIDPDGKYIVLAKHRPDQAQQPQGAARPFFSYTRACSAPYDPTRFYEVSRTIGRRHQDSDRTLSVRF